MAGTTIFIARQSDDKTAKLHDNAVLFCCLVLLAAPSLFALMTFEVEYAFDPIRQFSLPIVVAEGLIILAAARSGFSLVGAFSKLSTPSKIAAIVLGCVMLATTILAPIDPLTGRILFFLSLVHAVFALACWDRLTTEWRFARLKLIRFGIAGIALYLATVLLLAWSVRDVDEFAWLEFGAGVSNVRQLGFYGLVLSGLSVGMLANANTQRSTLIAALATFLGFFLCDWSGGRSAFGASILSITAIVAFTPRERRTKILAMAGALFLAAMPASMLASPNELYGSETILERAFGNASEVGMTEYSTGRLTIWTETIARIVERPLFGWGEGQFRHGVAAVEGKYNHPHNSVLQFLYQWGFVGTTALVVLLFGSIRRWPMAFRREPEIALPAFGVFSGLAAMSLLEGSFYHPLPIMFSLMSLALITSCKPTSSDTNSPDETSCDQDEPSPKLGDQGAA